MRGGPFGVIAVVVVVVGVLTVVLLRVRVVLVGLRRGEGAVWWR